MKKILYLVYVVIMAYVIVMNFMDYSCSFTNEMELSKIEITINKPETKSNEEFISDLINLSKELDMDIMYLITDASGKKIRKEYFVTTNTSDFLCIDGLDTKGILDGCDGITNTSIDGNYFRMKYSTLFYEVDIFDICEAEKYNLESCNFYINADSENRFIRSLTDEGYGVFRANGTVVQSGYLSLRTLVLPIMILLTSMLFYFINKRKEYVIKLLEGYSKFLIVTETSCKTCAVMLPIGIIVICLSAFVTMMIYNIDPIDYIAFSIKGLAPFFSFTIISAFIVNAVTVVSLKAYHMKGKNDNYDLYAASYILKMVYSLLVILSFSNVLLEIRSINDINRTNIRISNELKDYVALPVNSVSTSISNANQLEYNSRLDEFYDRTVDDYNGILINTRNYRVGSLETGDSLAEAYGQTRITVNENYLSLNIIYDTDGEPITEKNIVSHMFNLLLPESQKENEQDIIDSYAASYEIDKSEINCIFYKQDEEICTFNPYSGRKNGGVIFNPIIEIYDRDYLKDQMLNYVSGQYYLLKVDAQDPYAELLPLLKECGLDGIILYTVNISNVFDNSVASIRERLDNDLLNAILYAISIILLIIYNCTVYFQIYGKKICYKKLSGFSFMEIHMIPLISLVIQYMVFVLLSSMVSINREIILCVLIFEICTFAHKIFSFQKSYIMNVIKGET